ncbi:MAG TPA: hypothetical protein VNZ52_14805 [Candidatus Thermoplasmatota archaeon]|nr:hypothetical protein [Candidatus Thermoplasmatota archaeon]
MIASGPFEAVREFVEDPVGNPYTDALCESGVDRLRCELTDWVGDLLRVNFEA